VWAPATPGPHLDPLMRALLPTTLAALSAALAAPLAAPLAAQQPPAKSAAEKARIDSLRADSASKSEVWTPVPRRVSVGPGPRTPAPRPSDAIALFDGRSLGEWRSVNDSGPARWTVANGVLTVNKASGNIETRRRFTNYQLHLEFRIPPGIKDTGQARGNSGVFLASTGPGDAGYELQILNSYDNVTYGNGQAGSIYKQAAPLVNASRPAGEWQTYDVIWTAPKFGADGAVASPAYVTVLHNGVLVQDHFALPGETLWIGAPKYGAAHGALPIKLQSHGDPSPPISFRNIWVRELP